MPTPLAITTISDLTPAKEAVITMVFPVDAVNKDTGNIETLKLSLDQAFKLARAVGNEVPTGTPLPWLTQTLPAGYIAQDTAFDPLLYPELGLVYPSNRTPNMGGRTLKGASSVPEIGTFEEDQIKSHAHTGAVGNTDLGTKYTANAGNHSHSTNIESGVTGGTSSPARLYNTSKHTGYRAWQSSHQPDHSHAIAMGVHGHTLSINATGGSENRVKSIKCMWMFRAR